jgi:hypothetical protein
MDWGVIPSVPLKPPGAREDQAGKGYFLIGDGIADFIFGHRWLLECEMRKNPAPRHAGTGGAGCLDWPYFETGIGCDTGQRENCPSLALRPKLPATAGQREVRESRPLCRNRLLIYRYRCGVGFGR